MALNFWPAGQNDEAGAKRRAWRIEIKPQAIRAGQGAILGHKCCITYIDLLLLLLLTQPTLPGSRFGPQSTYVGLKREIVKGKTAKTELTALILEYLSKCCLTVILSSKSTKIKSIN